MLHLSGGRVTKITPNTGSLQGATKLTIHGEGRPQISIATSPPSGA